MRTVRTILAFAAATLLAAQGPAPLVPGGPPPAPGTGKGVGDLMVLPTRVVLEGRDRAAEVMLRNAGKVPAVYRVFMKEMKMQPDGQLKERPHEAGEITATDLVRLSPRQVELAPGEVQVVRFQVRKPEGLPDGEYHSHALFQAVPPAEIPKPLGPEDPTAPKGISFNITTVFGISIPIIVRHGQTQASVSLKDLRIEPPVIPEAPPELGLRIERTGNRSVLGNLSVVLESGGKAKKGTVLFEVKSLGVYTEISARDVRIPMAQLKDGSLKGARLRITFAPTDLKAEPQVAFFDIPL